MQAIGQVARCTIRLVSYAAASHPALDNITRMPRFMVRVRFRAKLAASIERMPKGEHRSLTSQGAVPPLVAAHVNH